MNKNKMRLMVCAYCGDGFIGNGNCDLCKTCRYERMKKQMNEKYAEKKIARGRTPHELNFDIDAVYRQIEPGMTKTEVARLMGRDTHSVDTLLVVFETHKKYLSEDEHGRLYPFPPPYSVAGD